MAVNLSSFIPTSASFAAPTTVLQSSTQRGHVQLIKCELNESSSSSSSSLSSSKRVSKIEIGSPIIVIEAPKLLKTAASVPCLRANGGLVNPGDVGRIVSRKPKDVWAVRLSIGTYLIDAKYFKLLELDD